MSGDPVPIRGHPYTGDPVISPIEYEVLDRKHREQEKCLTNWKWTGFFALCAALGGAVLWIVIDFTIWRAGGSLPYMQRGTDGAAWLVGFATGIVFAVLMLLLRRPKLLSLALLPAIMAGALASGFRYHEATAAKGQIEPETFYVRSLDLYSGRRTVRIRRVKASAMLVDRHGRHWALYGRFEYVQQLANQDCVTVALRQAGDYRFPVGRLALVETRYLDSIRNKRHPERCFATPIRS